MNLTEEQKKELLDYLKEKLVDVVDDEYYREYRADVPVQTRCLNASYTNGKAHGILEIVDDLIGTEEMAELHDITRQKTEYFIELQDKLYRE